MSIVDGDDFERRRQHRLEHYQVHFERMFPRERLRVDDDARRFSELGVRGGRFAQRRAPLRHRINRDARKRDAVSRANNDNSPRRLGAARPRAEGRRRDRAWVDEAGVGAR